MPASRKEEIFAACDRLQRDGIRITDARVLEEVGGSNTPVNRYVREWKKTASLKSLAPEVPSKFLSSLNQLFVEMKEELAEPLQEEKEQLTKELEALKDTHNKLAEGQEALLSEIAQLKMTNADLSQELETAAGQREELIHERARLKAQVRELEETKEDLRIEGESRLRQERDRSTQELTRIESIYQQAENRIMEDLARLRDANNGLQDELKVSQEKSDKLKEDLTSNLSEVNTKLTKSQAELAGATDRAEAVLAENQGLRDRLSGATKDREDDVRKLAVLEHENAQLKELLQKSTPRKSTSRKTGKTSATAIPKDKT